MLLIWWLTFMGHTVHSLFLPTLKGRERLLGWPGRGGRLLGRWWGLDEAAVEGVLWIVVGYWERKTNAEAERSAGGFCTILQEQQVCCHWLFNLLQSLKRWGLCGKVDLLLVLYAMWTPQFWPNLYLPARFHVHNSWGAELLFEWCCNDFFLNSIAM